MDHRVHGGRTFQSRSSSNFVPARIFAGSAATTRRGIGSAGR